LETRIEYGTVAMMAREKTRTAKAAVRATCYGPLRVTFEVANNHGITPALAAAISYVQAKVSPPSGE
jgi:hypothetical protein